MILYHGSSVEVSHPDLLHSRSNVDFGPGFYTTTLHAQAVKWCRKFRRNHHPGVVTHYTFDEIALKKCRVLQARFRPKLPSGK